MAAAAPPDPLSTGATNERRWPRRAPKAAPPAVVPEPEIKTDTVPADGPALAAPPAPATAPALGLNPRKRGRKRAAEAPPEAEEAAGPALGAQPGPLELALPRVGVQLLGPAPLPPSGLPPDGPAPTEAPSCPPPRAALPPSGSAPEGGGRSTVLPLHLPFDMVRPEVMRSMLLPLHLPPGLLLPPTAGVLPPPPPPPPPAAGRTGPRAWGGAMTAGVPGRVREDSTTSGGEEAEQLTALHAGAQSIDGARSSISRVALVLFKALSDPVLLVRPPARPGHGPGAPTALSLLDLIAGPPGVALAEEGDELPGGDRMGVLEREHAHLAAASLQNADRFAVAAAAGLKRLSRMMDARIAQRRERRLVPVLPDPRAPARPDTRSQGLRGGLGLGLGLGPDLLPSWADRMRGLEWGGAAPLPPPRSEDAASWSPQPPPPRSLGLLSPLGAASPLEGRTLGGGGGHLSSTSPFMYPPSTVTPLAASLAQALRESGGGGEGEGEEGKGGRPAADPSAAASAPPVARALGFTSPLTRPRFSATRAGLAASDVIVSPGRLYTGADLDASPPPSQGTPPLGGMHLRKMSFGGSPARSRRNAASQ